MSFRPIPVEEKLVEVGGLKLFVRLEGRSGKCPLVFLHGGPGSSHDYFVPHVGKLAQRRELILYDQRGCGKSEQTKISQYNKHNYVDELRALIRKLGFKKIDILGHSWGGFLAQMYALKYQNTVNRLILCCTASNTFDTNQELQNTWMNLPRSKRGVIKGYLKTGNHARGQPYPTEYVTLIHNLQSNDGTPPPFDAQQYTSLIFAGFSWPVYAKLMGGGAFEFKIDGDLEGFDMRKKLHEIQVPTLIMAGKYDAFTPEEAFNMSSLIPNSKTIIFEKSGHWPFLEENSKFISVTNNFLTL